MAMMKSVIAIATIVAATAPVLASKGDTSMEITRKSDLKSVDGSDEFFTGKATITGQFQRPAPSRVTGAIVHFEPGARTR